MGKEDSGISPSAIIECETLLTGENIHIGDNCILKAKKITIADGVSIDHDTVIDCTSSRYAKTTDTEISIGLHSSISYSTRIFVPKYIMGEYSMLYNYILIYGQKKLTIGHNCWIGENTILNAEDELIIGNNVGIGTYSQVWTHGYWGEALEGCLLNKSAPTVIEDDAWLIGHTIVSAGVRIGKQSTILPGAVLTKSTQEKSIWGGSPAIDMTDKVKAWKTVSLEEKLKMMRDYAKQFVEIEYPSQYQHEQDRILVSEDGYKFMIAFSDNYKEFQFKNESIDTILIVKQLEENTSPPENIVIFDLKSKRYIKRKLNCESKFILFLRSYRARFLPSDA